MPLAFKQIHYQDLNSQQQEAYNFQKVSAILADFGFVTIRLSDDWNGADFIAQHLDGTFLKVQLKGRLSFYEKYRDKPIHICFRDEGRWFLYPHDELLEKVLADGVLQRSESWNEHNGYSFPSIPKRWDKLLDPYRLPMNAHDD